MVVASRNPIRSLLSLIIVYLLVAGLFVHAGAEFVSIPLVIIYVGAISILFSFVTMMLNLRLLEVYDTLVINSPIGGFIGPILLFEFLVLFTGNIFTPTAYAESSSSYIH
jgi:NADH-quinone oxidoreductase subunit J